MQNANGLNIFPFMQRPPEKSDRIQGPISKMTSFTDTPGYELLWHTVLWRILDVFIPCLEKSSHFSTKICGESSGVKRSLFEFSFHRDHEPVSVVNYLSFSVLLTYPNRN